MASFNAAELADLSDELPSTLTLYLEIQCLLLFL